MKSSAVFLASHASALLFSLGLVIIGLMTASHRVSRSSCIGSTQGGLNDIDEVNKWSIIVGSLAVTSGTLSLVGTIGGAVGAWIERKAFLQSARIVIGIAVLAVVVVLLSGFVVGTYGCEDYTCAGQVCFRIAEEGQAVVDTGDAQKESEVPKDGSSQKVESAAGNFIESGSGPRCTPSDNKAQCTFEYICVADYDSLCKKDNFSLPSFFVGLIASFSMCGACCSEGNEASQLSNGPVEGAVVEQPAQIIGVDVFLPQGQIIQAE